MEALILTLGTITSTLGLAAFGYAFYKVIPNSVYEKIAEKLF